MKYYVAMFATLLLVVAATVGAYQAWDKATHTRDDSPGLEGGGAGSSASGQKPAQGQVTVAGHITAAHFEGCALPSLAMPVTVNTSSRGVGGATITPVVVAGASTSIDWNAGQPLPITGDGGSLKLSAVVCDVAADAISIGLDGVHALTPGDYTINTDVAVGATPKSKVSFTASDKTTVEFRGGASAPFPDPNLTVDGTGNATIEGTLTRTDPSGSSAPVGSVTLQAGNYHVVITTSAAGGFDIQATLQGTVS